MNNKSLTINNEQRLFVIKESSGYSCLGFDVCYKRANRLARELGEAFNEQTGTEAAYIRYTQLIGIARQKNSSTGFRSSSELHPLLSGLEGRRIKCELYGEAVRFNVGKSTGFIPCHLQIHNRRSAGGFAISADADIKNIQIIR